jgi:hypothetical protein
MTGNAKSPGGLASGFNSYEISRDVKLGGAIPIGRRVPPRNLGSDESGVSDSVATAAPYLLAKSNRV